MKKLKEKGNRLKRSLQNKHKKRQEEQTLIGKIVREKEKLRVLKEEVG